MAKHLDLEEQEQLDQIKHFWAQYGNAITWALIAVLGSFAAWNGWNYWQTNQAIKAAALYDEVQGSAQAGDVDRLKRALGEMQSGYAKTSYAGQSALLAARSFHDADQKDASREALEWTVTHGADPGYQAVARLRLASLALELGEFEAAMGWLNTPLPPAFEPLAADRRGDVLLAQGKSEEAVVQYQTAWRTMAEATEYRRLVEVKLASLGVDVLTQSGEVNR